MLKKLSAILVLILFVCSSVSYAQTITENFDTDPGWIGQNQTSGGNNVGYSASTNNADGASTGEFGANPFIRIAPNGPGGVVQSGDAIQGLDPSTDSIESSGTFNVTSYPGGSGANCFWGHYRSTSGYGGQGYPEGFLIFFTDLGGSLTQYRIFFGAAVVNAPTAGALGHGTYDVGTTYTYHMSYDPSANSGDGALTLSIDGTPVTYNLGAGDKDTMQNLDRFGFSSQDGDSVGSQTSLFFDDVEYTGVAVSPPTATSIIPDTNGPVTSADTVSFEVGFSEAVTNFNDASDLIITYLNGAGAGNVSISGGPTTYTVQVDGVTSDGSYKLAVNPASDVESTGSSTPLSSSVVSSVVRVDNTAPVYQFSLPTSGSVVAEASTITLYLDDIVTGAVAGDVTVNGSAATNLSVDGFALTFTGFVSPGDGAVTVNIGAGAIVDSAGNAFAGASYDFTVNSGSGASQDLFLNDENFDSDPGWLGINNTGASTIGFSNTNLAGGASAGELAANPLQNITPAVSSYADESGSLDVSSQPLVFEGKIRYDLRTAFVSFGWYSSFSTYAGSGFPLGLGLFFTDFGGNTEIYRLFSRGTFSVAVIQTSADALVLDTGESYDCLLTYNPVGDGTLSLSLDGYPLLELALDSGNADTLGNLDRFGISSVNRSAGTGDQSSLFVDDITYTATVPIPVPPLTTETKSWDIYQ